jgi:hypothetical protein
MLRELIIRIRERGLCHQGELARYLGVSGALVQSMLTELEREGYVRSTAIGTSHYCHACPERMTCTVRRLRIWALTARGKELASSCAAHPNETLSRVETTG